ncbi:glycosyltransferase [Rhodococcus hoagii]|nr:glycosyltransferase [Prescottella equi]
MSESTSAAPAVGQMAEIRDLLPDGPSDHLVAQRGLFAGPSPRVTDKMYAKIVSGAARFERRQARLEQGAVIETNTYFGRFPASFWQRWTTVTSVRLTLAYESTGSASIALRASDAKGRKRLVTQTTVEGTGTVTLEGRLDRFVDGGAMWFEAAAESGSLTITDVRWIVDAPERLRPAAVAICTFNRADDCLATVGTLAADAEVMAGIDTVCVVDQGTDQVRSRPGFADLEAALGEKLMYRTQANLGGAGGFARGMHEIVSEPETAHSNVILMDDDILCEPETVLRMNAFANMTAQPALVGAQMLSLSNPQMLHVSAEREVLDEIKAGNLTTGAMMGVDLVKKRQEERFDAGWNGWWTCLIPGEIIAECGLPLPLFFQWDDIEYGIRARFAGHPTITLPNAGVWHADFHLKDYDDWSRYFSIRNGLIVSAIYGRFDGATIAKYLFRKTSELIVSMQYGLAATFIQAAEDFLKGPSFLDDGGQAVLRDIRELRAKYPETVARPAVEVGAEADRHTQLDSWKFEPDEKREPLVLAKRAVQQFLGRVDGRPVAIPATYANWWHVSLFSQATVTDASQGAVRVRRRDKQAAVELARRAAKVCWQLRKEAPQMKTAYTEALPQITSAENWTRLFQSGK